MKGEQIAGIRVKTGEIKQHDLLHLKRGEEIIANPVIKLMMHGKDEIQVVKSKHEAGLTFKNKKIDFQVGDLIIAYHQEE
jgi:translation initiation factor IF-2